jgi:hypothetical protein
MLPALAITISREVRHWRIEVQVKGGVEPSTVFGCYDGMMPMLGGLLAAEAEVNAVAALPERKPAAPPPTVTVRMPSGRLLTFELARID